MAKCGSHAGYTQHYRNGTEVCRPCQDAFNAYHRAWRAERRAQRPLGPPPLDPAKCGTPNQARNHSRRGEKPCEACRLARNRHRQDTRKSRAVPGAKKGRPLGSHDKAPRRRTKGVPD